MAFIREYGAAGDPFSLRIPKKLRKLKVGRALGSVARLGASFIPGVGGMVAQALAPPEPEPVPVEPPPQPMLPDWLLELLQAHAPTFARAYGYDMGDPGAPRPQKKRKAAGAGPKAKAAKKANVRTQRAQRAVAKAAPAAKGKRGKKGGGVAIDPDLAGGLMEFAQGQLQGQQEGGGLFGALGLRGKKGGAAFGGHRRTMNVANVKALRRSMRRVEGFEKLARRVMPHVFRHSRSGSRAKASGHKRGCKCVVCSRAA
ncbi:MAG TPA: hypothetical protein VJN39_14825 [Gemmatimonadales bacterium]|nr:hypothetical protein [Gemmatimonadales bacterium]